MCKVISIINNKGGVGKTTTELLLSELLAYLGKKVLCVDHDGQGNSSLGFHAYIEDSEAVLKGRALPEREHIAELYKYRYRTKEEVRSLIRPTHIVGVDIIPSSNRHKGTPADVIKNTGNNNIILKKALACIKDDYDYILIDNAPANDILTVNSIFASNYIITPVRVEGYSYKGLKETLADILYIKNEHDLEGVEFLGAFITQASVITNAYKDRKEICETALHEKFLKTPIRADTKINEMESKHVSLINYCPTSNALHDYAMLLLEMNILDEDAQKELAEIFQK